MVGGRCKGLVVFELEILLWLCEGEEMAITFGEDAMIVYESSEFAGCSMKWERWKPGEESF